jgi:hypothetical protein
MAAYPDKYDYNEARVSPIQVALLKNWGDRNAIFCTLGSGDQLMFEAFSSRGNMTGGRGNRPPSYIVKRL